MLKSNRSETVCRICGYDSGEIRWEVFQDIEVPLNIKCKCCGAIAGHQDDTIENIRKYRSEWQDRIERWSDITCKPDNWNVNVQLGKIPEEFMIQEHDFFNDGNQDETICRVCGVDEKESRWQTYDGRLYPNYFICSCCGCESGLADSWLEGIRNYRNKWLNEGAKWRYPESKPINWNLEKQLEQIPQKYK